jgi:HlyD family secretion protein
MKKSKPSGKRKLTRIFGIAAAAAVVVIAAGYYVRGKIDSPETARAIQLTSHVVKRGNLVVSVTESGDIKALNTTDIMNKVEGRTSLISIVPEGTVITEEDVKNGRVIAELDSSSIRESLAQQEVTFSNAEADLEDAKESLSIQIKQNESDVQSGELNKRFALMDFKKYLGEELADTVVTDYNETTTQIDAPALLSDERLNGEALQRLKELKNNISITEGDLNRAKKTLEGTERLFEKQYVAEMELIADKLDVQSLEAKLENSKIALELFKLYEFPKQTQQLLSNYHEAMRELDRIEARARSRLAQEQAKLRNKKATYDLQKERLDKFKNQLEACTIKAPVPGQVVYGSSLLDARQRQRELIEVGAEIYERQRIISIPDSTNMKVDLKVHETWIGKIEQGQPAKIVVSAFPDRTFDGKVLRKAPLADPENFWNPDVKVYSAEVLIDGTHPFIKSGMSARVEIIISHLKDVLTVPIQSVITDAGRKYCYVLNSEVPVRRQVELGDFNSDFVEVKSGLTEGDRVLLNPPRAESSRASKAGPAAEPVEGQGQGSQSDQPQEGVEEQQTGAEEQPQRGAEEQSQAGTEEQGGQRSFTFELTDERIEQIMQGMKQFNPEKYEQLNKLRQEDPAKFKEELQKEMQQFMQQMRNRQGQGGGPGGGFGGGRGDGTGSGRGGFRRSRDGAQQGD